MKELLKRHKGVIALVITIVAFYSVLFFLGISCPIKWLFGVSCPGCGMTRATLSALFLNFSDAFYYHPLWLLPLPSLLLWIYFRHKGRRAICNIVLGVVVACFISVYIIRLLCSDGSVVAITPGEGAIKRAIDYVLNTN